MSDLCKYYVLEGHSPVECDLNTWQKSIRNGPTRVARTDITDKIIVSTVFLGLNHRYLSEGPPILFETMTFGGSRNETMYRYSSWDDAEAGHNAEVKRVRQALKVLENKD